MILFKSISDVEQYVHNPAYATLKKLVANITSNESYRPEEDGYIVIIEPEDVDRVLDDLRMPYRLAEVPWEGVNMMDGFFYAFFLANNQFGIGFLIPDADWVNGILREVLV